MKPNQVNYHEEISHLNNPRLAGLRKRGIKGFEKYLIFYLSQDEFISVVRIIHAARDLPIILEQE